MVLSELTNTSRSSTNVSEILEEKLQRCDSGKALSLLLKHSASKIFDSKNCIQALFYTFRKLKANLRNRDISGLLNVISKIRPASDSVDFYCLKLMSSLSRVAMEKMNNLEPRDIALIVNSFAKKKIPNDPLLEGLATLIVQKLPQFNAQDISTTVNAYAKLNYKRRDCYLLFEKAANVAVPIIHTFDLQALSNTVHAYAKLNIFVKPLFQEIARAIVPKLKLQETKYSAQNLCNTLNAYAKVNYLHKELFESTADASITIINSFNSRDLTIMLSVYAKMTFPARDLFDAIAKKILKFNSILYDFDTKGLASMANAYCKFGYRDHTLLMNEIIRHATEKMNEFQSKDVAILLHALTKLGHFESCHEASILLEKAASIVILPNLVQMSPHTLSVTINAYANSNSLHRHSHSFTTLFEQAAKVAITKARCFSVRDCFMLTEAFSMMEIRNELLQDALVKTCLMQLHTCDAKGLVSVLTLFRHLPNTKINAVPKQVASHVVHNKTKWINKWDLSSLIELVSALSSSLEETLTKNAVEEAADVILVHHKQEILDDLDLTQLVTLTASCTYMFSPYDDKLSSTIQGILHVTLPKIQYLLTLKTTTATSFNIGLLAKSVMMIQRGEKIVLPDRYIKILVKYAIQHAMEVQYQHLLQILRMSQHPYLLLASSKDLKHLFLEVYRPIVTEVAIFLSQLEKEQIFLIYAKHDEHFIEMKDHILFSAMT